jgi:hypothetical protein
MAPKGLGYFGDCPECYGTGAVDTLRRWLRACRHLVGHSLGMLFLSIFSGLTFGIPAVLALCFILWLCGVDDPDFQTAYRGVAGLIALGIFAGWWFSEDGPARPGRRRPGRQG